MRDSYIRCRKGNLKVYWGSVQWSLTHECVEYIISTYNEHDDFNKWFIHAFPSDELYFATIVHNSEFASRTQKEGPEAPQKDLTNWRNLHYFEYLLGHIKVFTYADTDFIKNLNKLFIHKVGTDTSEQLLDWIDKNILLND